MPRPRRRLAAAAFVAALLALAVAAGLAACGGSSSSSPKGPRAEALSYFPSQPGVVGLVDTDLSKGQLGEAKRLADRFPGSDLALNKLRDEIERGGLSYERDMKPLLGNEVAFGGARPGPVHSKDLLVALVARDGKRVGGVIERRRKAGKLRAAGSHAHAQLYTTGSGAALARRGSTLLVAGSVAVLNQALDRREGGDGLTPDKFQGGLGDLPKDALVRVVGDARQLLSGASAARLRRIPWLGALGTFALTVRAADDGVRLAFRADTGDGDLADADVPIATGAQVPTIRGNGDLVVGIRDPAHLIAFVERAAQALSPQGFAAFQANEAQIKRKVGVDLERDLARQLTGSASIVSDLHSFAMVADVRDGSAMSRTLRRLQPVMPAFLEGAGITGTKVQFIGDTTWVVRRDGRVVFSYGLAAGKLVLGNAGIGRMRALATARTTSVPGARGALVARLSADALQRIVSKQLGLGFLGGLALGALGDVTGWVQASKDGLRGELALAIH